MFYTYCFIALKNYCFIYTEKVLFHFHLLKWNLYYFFIKYSSQKQ